MSARVDADAQGQLPPPNLATAGVVALPILPLDTDDRWGGHTLPNDHPPWLKDAVSISHRARALIATLKPAVVKVVTYWEHRIRSIVVGDRRVSVDPSGCYKLD